ncbi:SurA N-terminal domain-containing protein [Nevskia soli]|uniref:SurA N-terminal domain-containing protein n=1 Tax=Nevskia soli TaxID=418856 RepID=UPI0004A70BF6|nr:SurA N-terminal domain-containing protein [Nevskia soli]
MLQTIRDRMTGPILWGIVGVLIVPFAFFGIQSLQSGGGADPTVAEVGGVKITQSQFHGAYQRAYQDLQQRMGPDFRADELQQNQLRDNVLKSLVQDLVLQQYTRDTGYRIDDAGVREYLEAMPYFQENGHFSADRYRSALSSVGQSPEQFEARVRQQLPVEQLRGAVLDSAFITPREGEAAWKLQRQQRVFSYVKFEPAKYLASVTVSDDQVKQRYEQKKDSYKAPERIKLAYVELALDQLPKAAAPSADVLKAIYEARKAGLFSTPEQRRASHILIAFGADKDAAKKKADDLYDKIKAGADFAELAKANSDDPGSKNKGGDLGLVKHGMMVPKFESALFALNKAGEVSEPVQTEFGWHLIKLDELKPAETQAFDDPAVQKQLLDLYQQQDAVTRFNDMSTKLDQMSFENPASLDPVAKALNLQVKTTDWFTRKGGGDIAANQAVIAAAFSSELIKDDNNSKPIAIDPQHLVVVRKAEYEAPRQLQQADVAEQIRGELKDEAAKAKAKAGADALLKSLADGQTFELATKAAGVASVSPGAVQRDNKDLPPALVQALFKMPHPASGKLGYGQAALDNGDIAVIALSAVNDPATQSSDVKDMQSAGLQLRNARAGSEFSAYRDAVEKEVKVKIKATPLTSDADAGG